MRAWTCWGNSAASERSADTGEAETGSLSAACRNSRIPARFVHSAQIKGSPPVIKAASKAEAVRAGARFDYGDLARRREDAAA